MISENRIQSIDALRAITMLLMIWVNDFWSLEGVPLWLQHMPAEADALGFSDVIFPVFLFIVGLSVPFAIRQRQQRGDSTPDILWHIAQRSFALLVMGVMMVNLENFDSTASYLPRPLWQVLMVVSFCLIWNDYSKRPLSNASRIALQSSGWILLALLAASFRSDPENGYNWIETHWWGILGLIGWSYLIAACVQLFAKGRSSIVAAGWAFLALFNIASFAGWLEWLSPAQDYVWIVSSGSLPALTLAGALVSTVYLERFAGKNGFLASLIIFGIATLILGLLLRPFWGISKIQATPAWTHICTGIGALSFAALYYIVDTTRHEAWTRWLRPAGVATLTCYLIPYLAYPLLSALSVEPPEAFRSGLLGLAKSMLFAYLIIVATGGLNRLGVKLRI